MKLIATMILSILCSNAIAQYSRATTISVLTNNASRKWQLGTTKSMGGCIEETLVVEFRSDMSAAFQYCQHGKWQPVITHWTLLPGNETNAWFIKFDTPLTYTKGSQTLELDSNRLTLRSPTLHHKGDTLTLSKILPGKTLPMHILGNFYAKN